MDQHTSSSCVQSIHLESLEILEQLSVLSFVGSWKATTSTVNPQGSNADDKKTKGADFLAIEPIQENESDCEDTENKNYVKTATTVALLSF